MPQSSLLAILQEIKIHPRERVGFIRADTKNLTSEESDVAKAALVDAISEGDIRCNEPLNWILGEEYETELLREHEKLDHQSHGSVYLPYVLFEKSKDPKWIKKMKDGIREADVNWGMRRTALTHLKKIIGKDEFTQFCWFLVKDDPSPAMRKAAARNIATQKGLTLDSDLRNTIETHIESIDLSQEETDMQRELEKLKKTINYSQ